jgi:hypothetical protein
MFFKAAANCRADFKSLLKISKTISTKINFNASIGWSLRTVSWNRANNLKNVPYLKGPGINIINSQSIIINIG